MERKETWRWMICILMLVVTEATPHPPSNLPRFVIEPAIDGPIRPGSPVLLSCSVEAQKNGSATLNWLVNGQRSSAGALRRRGIEVSGGQLRIPAFNSQQQHQQTHEGIYQCLAENQYGAVLSSEVKLEAAVLLSLNSGRSTNSVVKVVAFVGATVHINCPQVLSRPQATYDIMFNDSKLQLTARHKLLPSGMLLVTRVTHSDQGRYKCLAHNSALGTRVWVDNTTFNLRVVPVTEIVGQRAANVTMTVASRNLTGTSRQNLTLECAASGWPHVDIRWEKYGGHLPASKTFQDSGYLIIANAQKSDEGTYECICTAKGADGGEVVLREAASVTIVEPPTAEISPEVQSVVEGSTVTLKCKSSGSPKISYRWFFNGVQVTSEQFVTVRDSSLTMSNVNRKRTGAYQCFASNSAGSSHGVTRLVVTRSRSEGSYADEDDVEANYEVDWDSKSEASKPSRGDITITKPSATLEQDLSVRLSWLLHPKDHSSGTGGGGAGGFSFKVQMKNLEGGHGWETMRDNLPFSTRSYNVQRDVLMPGKTYRFRICLSTPTRACINSPESIKVFVSPNHPNVDPPTVSRKKPPQPIIVQAQVISCTKIEIGWQLPDYALDELDYDSDAAYYEGGGLVDRPEEGRAGGMGDTGDNDDSDYIYHSRQQLYPDAAVHHPHLHHRHLRYQPGVVESFYVHYAPYQEQEKVQTLRVEEGRSRSVSVSNLKPSTAYSFRMQSVLSDATESDYSNSIVKETTECYNPSRQHFDGQPGDDTGDYDPYSFQSRNPVRTPGGRGFNEFASQSLYVVGGVLFVIVVAALVIAMIVCLYRRKSKEGGTDKSHQMNQTLMHCYQATQHQLNGHTTTVGSAHLPSCNGHCTMAHTLGANSLQGAEYCRPMECDSRVLVNQLQPCLNNHNGKKPPPDLDLPPPPPLPPFQNSAYRGDTSHGEDALLYDQLSDPDDNKHLRNSAILLQQQQAPFQNGGIYHPLSQHNSPASGLCQAKNSAALQRTPGEEAKGNAYWVLENFSRTPSEGSASAVSGGYYVTGGTSGLPTQPLLPLQEHQQQQAIGVAPSGCFTAQVNAGSSSSTSSSSRSADSDISRRQMARHSPTSNLTFEPQMYRLARDCEACDGGDATCRHGNGYALT